MIRLGRRASLLLGRRCEAELGRVLIGRVGSERHRRPPLAPVAPHQPRHARDAADALERRSVVRRKSRVQAGARAAERDPARGLVQLGS
jgi:hypothetical protein